MANMKAKHAFGTLEKIDEALSNGTIDSYDILFVKNADGKPFVGWIDKDGNKVICDDSAEFDALLKQIATKANVADVEALETEIANKASSSDVEALETEMKNKVDASDVQTMIEEHSSSVIEVIEF